MVVYDISIGGTGAEELLYAIDPADLPSELVRDVLVLLFTDARARDDDDVDPTDRRGWWADSYAATGEPSLGSRLWLLADRQVSDDTASRAQQYAETALAPLVDAGVASKINVAATRSSGGGRIALSIEIIREGRETEQLRFADLWEALSV